jgi:hypothetical protein
VLQSGYYGADVVAQRQRSRHDASSSTASCSAKSSLAARTLYSHRCGASATSLTRHPRSRRRRATRLADRVRGAVYRSASSLADAVVRGAACLARLGPLGYQATALWGRCSSIGAADHFRKRCRRASHLPEV